MSAPNALNLVIAALPANSGKPAAPPAAEAAAENTPPFAAVLQQKVSRIEGKPTATPTSKAAAEPADKADAAALTTAPDMLALAETKPADSLLPWLNGLPVQATAGPHDTAVLPVATDNAATPDSLNLLAGQTMAGLIQATQAQGNSQTVAGTAAETQKKPSAPDTLLNTGFGAGKETQPQFQTDLGSHLPDHAASDSANLAAEAIAQGANTAKHGLASEPNPNNFAQVLANLSPIDKPVLAERPQVVVNTPVNSEAWPTEMGERLVWMSNRHESRAELILTPPQMGKIEVSLNISGDQASVSFVSSNPQVREALEAAMNRLREVLADSGINLGQTNVGAESSSTWAQQQKNGDNANSMATDPALAADGSAETLRSGALTWQNRGNGMVDVFA